MRVTFGKKTNKHQEAAAGLPENEENVKGLRFWWAPNLLAGLRNHCFQQQIKAKSALRQREKQTA